MTNKRPYLDKQQPAIYKAIGEVSNKVQEANKAAGIEDTLSELINVRVSQMNACNACMSIHLPLARKAGVSDIKLDLLPAWQDSTVYNERERAALRLAEALTFPQEGRATLSGPALTQAIAEAAEVFNEEELAAIEWTTININTFNRVSIASNHPPVTRNYEQ